MPRYLQKSIKYYIDRLSARTPVPGGGSVAALLGALGSGLLSMVANYAAIKAKSKTEDKIVKKALNELKGLKLKLSGLIDADIRAYERLSRALKTDMAYIPKVQSLLKDAVQPPLKTCIYSHRSAAVSLKLAAICSKYLISDVCVAIYTLDAAFESALLNIDINLKRITDKRYVTERIKEYKRLRHSLKDIKAAVFSIATKRMVF